jgi:hypothetical protein
LEFNLPLAFHANCQNAPGFSMHNARKAPAFCPARHGTAMASLWQKWKRLWSGRGFLKAHSFGLAQSLERQGGAVMKVGFRFVVCIVSIVVLSATTATVSAMDCWTALAMIESGGQDSVVGSHGEISRYQILPSLWRGGSPLNSRTALANAQRIMAARVQNFKRANGRAPSDFEFYVLWNAPAQIKHPHGVVAERARRFVNLTADSLDPRRELAMK